ncbi:hypothetical protein MTR_0024s0340 [Medicago truncatula]|uniref:Uncharacterized protein n=1 Tax=Medicago truncatula TaxID=3880 RepID=A0A072TK99_MEDTR|nr:hypothetical protein MTR_0024s0340 [Medicago truncatula]
MGAAIQSPEPSNLFERKARCVIPVDCFLKCILTKTGSEIRVFQDLQTHFICIRDFTSRNVRISTISSSWRTVRVLRLKVKTLRIFCGRNPRRVFMENSAVERNPKGNLLRTVLLWKNVSRKKPLQLQVADMCVGLRRKPESR